MSSEWATLQTIGELLVREGGSIKTGPFGTTLKASEYAETGVPLISVREIGHGTFHIDKKTPRVCEATLARLPEYILQTNDIVFARKGGIERCALVRKPQTGWFLGSDGIRLRPPKSCDARFIAYFLQTKAVKEWLVQNSTGSTMASLNQATIGRIPVSLPSIQEQTSIADTLETLDDRITLLRETNATLEAIAQALFKSWFVDFDPVRAKQEGRVPEGMDEATPALFPDGFEESELGLVPRGWRVGTLADLMRLHKGSVNPGAHPDSEFQHFSLPAFDAGQMPIFESGSAIKSNKTTVPENAVLLSKLNPHIPRVWLPSFVEERAVCSTEFLPFVPTVSSTTALVYCLLAAPDFSVSLCQLVTGTSNSHQRVKPDGVLSLPSIVPSRDVVTAFDNLANVLLARLKANREQAQTLTTLRDTLLPRLISGQLRLPDTEALIEEVTA